MAKSKSGATGDTLSGNTLYYGDCLEVMEKFLADQSIDLIYLDPPFNSNADYDIIFGKQRNGEPAQVTAFGDTWRWGGRGTEDAIHIAGALKHPAHTAVSALMTLLGECGMMAYLGYMAQRLVVMHSKLKDTGTLYLHCDTTASHYLKILLDSVFGPQNYLNEISWLRSQPKSHAKVNLSRCRDLILVYGKSENVTFHKIPGMSITYNWDDIEHLHNSDKEKLLYPTQKPVSLLERILEASSNPGDLVLDPFCGCGTTIVAAEKLGRRWVGIDISPVAIDVMTRERKDFPVGNFQVRGISEDLDSAVREKPEGDFKRYLLSGPKFDDFEIPRRRDMGREADL